MIRASAPPLCALGGLCGEIPLSLSPLESALAKTRESLSKQTTLTYSESTLTARNTRAQNKGLQPVQNQHLRDGTLQAF